MPQTNMTTAECLQPQILVVKFGPAATIDTASGIKAGLTRQEINCGPLHLDKFARPAEMPVFDTSAVTREKLRQAGLAFEVIEGEKVADYLLSPVLPKPPI